MLFAVTGYECIWPCVERRHETRQTLSLPQGTEAVTKLLQKNASRSLRQQLRQMFFWFTRIGQK